MKKTILFLAMAGMHIQLGAMNEDSLVKPSNLIAFAVGGAVVLGGGYLYHKATLESLARKHDTEKKIAHAEKEALNSELAELKSLQSELEKSTQSLKNRLANLQDNQDGAAKLELDALRNQLKQSVQNEERLAEKIAALEASNGTISKSLTDAKINNNLLERQIKQLEAKVTEHEARVAKLLAEAVQISESRENEKAAYIKTIQAEKAAQAILVAQIEAIKRHLKLQKEVCQIEDTYRDYFDFLELDQILDLLAEIKDNPIPATPSQTPRKEAIEAPSVELETQIQSDDKKLASFITLLTTSNSNSKEEFSDFIEDILIKSKSVQKNFVQLLEAVQILKLSLYVKESEIVRAIKRLGTAPEDKSAREELKKMVAQYYQGNSNLFKERITKHNELLQSLITKGQNTAYADEEPLNALFKDADKLLRKMDELLKLIV